MILNKTNNGASPIIGVILLVALFTGVIILLSFNLFSSNIGVVTESMDADINFETTENGVSISIFQNENINKLIVRHEDGRETELDINSSTTQNIDFGTGKYYLIGENESNERLISTNQVNELLEINAPNFVSTNEEIEYSISTNVDEENIDSYDWDFDNGETSSKPNPKNTYTNDGIFETKLTITVDGEEITTSIEITVDNSQSTSSEPEDVQEVNNNLDGDGTTQSPYIIMDDHDLQSINADLSAHYELGQNINATRTDEWNDGAGFEPIGNAENKFMGSIDGVEYNIRGLSINRENTSYIGLFGHTESAEISNIILRNNEIKGQSEVGSLVGLNENSNIIDSNVDGYVFGEGNFRIGGLVGYNRGNSMIINSYAETVVVGNNNNVGGLVGKNENSIIKESYALGDIEGDNNNIGGLVGANVLNGEVKNSYSRGSITGINNTYTGGVVGYNKDGLINNTYSTSMISSDGIKGGLIGRNDDELYNSYWNSETGESESMGINNSDLVSNDIGLLTDEMQGESAKDNMTELDFTDIWRSITEPSDNYPELKN